MATGKLCETVTVLGAGTAVAIDVLDDDGSLAAEVRRAWSRAITDERPVARVSVARTADWKVADVAHEDPHVLLERLSQRVTREVLGAGVGRLLMFHASGLADLDTGRSAVFVAPSRTGKTTLARELGDRFGYLTDESLAIGEGVEIWPYPKPLSVRFSPDKRRELSADELGLGPTPRVASVARLVLLDRDPALGEVATAEELDDFDAIVELVSQTSSLAKLERPLHRLQKLIGDTGPVVKLHYSSAESVYPIVRELVSP